LLEDLVEFRPAEMSQTKIRSPTPTWVAANPIPGAAYMVWIMSSTSCWISDVISPTGSAGACSTPAP